MLELITEVLEKSVKPLYKRYLIQSNYTPILFALFFSPPPRYLTRVSDRVKLPLNPI